jgi:predicted acylesterase/phospholipase RssA
MNLKISSHASITDNYSTKIKRLLILACILLEVACSSIVRRDPVPVSAMQDVQILDGKALYRFSPLAMSREALADLAVVVAHQRQQSGFSRDGNVSILALSGGGAGGAYGAGILYGWTSYGDRPEFGTVTGISTGSLIAPFVFLGPDYDEPMKKVFTTSSSDDIFFSRSMLSFFRSDAVNDSIPLQEMISENFNKSFIDQIAAEHNRGRRLYVGTTNLDSQKAFIWDMGAIANSDHPDAIKLFQKVILASTAIPAILPPVYIPVTVDGEELNEMHVDGGVSTQVYVFPMRLRLDQLDAQQDFLQNRSLYVIRNAKLSPDPAIVNPRTLAIAGRSLSMLINSQGQGDLFRIYTTAKRDNIGFHLAFIPNSFDIKANELFDPVQMKALFELGYDHSRSSYNWTRSIDDWINSRLLDEKP